MLDLQRVKQRMEGPSSVGDLRSLSFNRFDAALGSVGAALEPGDIWGDGAPEDENAEEDQPVATEECDSPASRSSPRPAGPRAALRRALERDQAAQGASSCVAHHLQYSPGGVHSTSTTRKYLPPFPDVRRTNPQSQQPL